MPDESITLQSALPLVIVVTGGGTGGHISPIIATVEKLRRCCCPQFHWVGSFDGAERDAAARLGIPYHAVHTGKLRRYADLATVVDLVRVPAGIVDALRIVRRLRPAVMFSSGGFVGVPAVVAARLLRIPSLTHEQTAYLGLATRINSRFSDVIALSYADASTPQRMHRARVVVTGNPVRSGALDGDARRLRARYAIPDDTPIIYVTGGMRGAAALNRLVEDALPHLVERVFVFHQCGPSDANNDYKRLIAVRESLHQDKRGQYHVTQTVGDELGLLYAAARLVIGRAGAGTVAELAAVGKPSILIPLPGAEEQRRNAFALANAGAAIVLSQEQAIPAKLIALVDDLLNNAAAFAAMGERARTIATPDAASRLVEELLQIARRGD